MMAVRGLWQPRDRTVPDPGVMEAGMARTRVIVFLVFDGMKMLDVTGPAEVFAEANRFGADYRHRYASPSGQAVTTSIGVASFGAAIAPATNCCSSNSEPAKSTSRLSAK